MCFFREKDVHFMGVFHWYGFGMIPGLNLCIYFSKKKCACDKMSMYFIFVAARWLKDKRTTQSKLNYIKSIVLPSLNELHHFVVWFSIIFFRGHPEYTQMLLPMSLWNMLVSDIEVFYTGLVMHNVSTYQWQCRSVAVKLQSWKDIMLHN